MTFGAFEVPPQCDPQNQFLASVSSLLNTCIPTPFAFISTLLGTLSIISWLFAQLPQVIKNYKVSSTSGLSIYFLVEWCLGDATNLVGGVLTNQAAWQVIIGAYYCFVDVALISQWIWYDLLHHGRKLRLMWRSTFRRDPDLDSEQFTPRIFAQSIRGQSNETQPLMGTQTDPKDVPGKNQFNQVHYGSLSPNAEKSSPNRTIQRVHNNSHALPSPSPRTFLMIAMLIALAKASPVSIESKPTDPVDQPSSFSSSLGTAVSWTSAFLYLGSRLPQIYKNWRLRSTAGLSPLLFAAAFCGNFFYSTSMIFNPCAWESFPAFGGRGWIRDDPSDQAEWLSAALPFFIGSGGVLMMDATVGLQFWYFGHKKSKEQEEVIVVRQDSGSSKKWQEVTGWMRGWKPSISAQGGKRRADGTESTASSEEYYQFFAS